MRIRRATLEDAEALRAYATALFAERLPGIYERPAPTLDDERQFILAHTGRDNATLLLAEEDGAVIGLIGFDGRMNREERHVGCFGLSVAQGHRGRGIGSALLEELLAWARLHGIMRVEAEVCSDNPRAADLYRRHGFHVEGRRVAAIRRDDGSQADMLMMVRLLP